MSSDGAEGVEMDLSKFIGKVRPQIMVALLILGGIAVLGIRAGMVEISVGSMAGIIALAKDVLSVDA